MSYSMTKYIALSGIVALALMPAAVFGQQATTTTPAPAAQSKQVAKVPEVVTVNGKISMKETPAAKPGEAPTKSYSIMVTDAKNIAGTEVSGLKGKSLVLSSLDQSKTAPLVGKNVIATGTLSTDNKTLTATAIKEQQMPKKPAA